MKKRIILNSIIGIVSLIAVLLIVASYKNLERSKRKKRVLSSLKAVTDSLGIVTRRNREYSVLVYFNSECDYCRKEIQGFSDIKNDLKKYDLYLISIEPQGQALQFLETYGLQEYFVRTRSESVLNIFPGIAPQTLIYKDNKLYRHFKGEVDADIILKQLYESLQENK